MRIYFKFVILSVVSFNFFSSHAGSYEDFFQALRQDDSRAVQGLFARGFDPNTLSPQGQYPLVIALREPSPKVLDLLLKNPLTRAEVRTAQDESPLMFAALNGLFDVCEKLIALDADVNKPGWTPLHYAATGGSDEVLRLLIENHAYLDAESPNGSTPLMMAAMYGQATGVKILLDAGADPELKNSQGLSAIDFARRAEHQESEDLIAAAIRSRQPKGTW
jgi:ankyrin repeat protein